MIEFHCEDVELSLHDETKLKQWLETVISREKGKKGKLSYIFCSDNYLYDLNVTYLQHDTLTDVITFQYAQAGVATGDIFISLERIHDNAADFSVSTEHELRRVMVHGLLHLLGYGDKTPDEKTLMTHKEDVYLQLYTEL